MLNQEIIFLLANKYIKNLCYLFNGPVINKERKFDHPKASILMTHHYPDLGSVFDCLKQISYTARPIRSTTQIWVVMSSVWNFYVASQTLPCGETIGGLAKCRLFSQVILFLISFSLLSFVTIPIKTWSFYNFPGNLVLQGFNNSPSPVEEKGSG